MSQFIQTFLTGGFMMWPLLAASIVTIAIAVERTVFYRRSASDMQVLQGEFLSAVRAKNFDERNIRSLSIHEWVELRKHSLSMLFQELRIFPELTALENVQLKNRLTNYKKKKEILALFETLGISEKVNEKAGKLSFGQQQRVAFIRALCQPFDFIFLDEPISHLDDDNGTLMGRMLTEEAERQGAGIIVTSIGKHIELEYNKVMKL